jgi:hypothetical protein
MRQTMTEIEGRRITWDEFLTRLMENYEQPKRIRKRVRRVSSSGFGRIATGPLAVNLMTASYNKRLRQIDRIEYEKGANSC